MNMYSRLEKIWCYLYDNNDVVTVILVTIKI